LFRPLRLRNRRRNSVCSVCPLLRADSPPRNSLRRRVRRSFTLPHPFLHAPTISLRPDKERLFDAPRRMRTVR
jgi:hypothetical protein